MRRGLRLACDFFFKLSFTLSIDNSSSSLAPSPCGVPQGAILGPYIFFIKPDFMFLPSENWLTGLIELEPLYVCIRKSENKGSILKDILVSFNTSYIFDNYGQF